MSRYIARVARRSFSGLTSRPSSRRTRGSTPCFVARSRIDPSWRPSRPVTSTDENRSFWRPRVSKMAWIAGPPIFKRVMARRTLSFSGMIPRRRRSRLGARRQSIEGGCPIHKAECPWTELHVLYVGGGVAGRSGPAPGPVGTGTAPGPPPRRRRLGRTAKPISTSRRPSSHTRHHRVGGVLAAPLAPDARDGPAAAVVAAADPWTTPGHARPGYCRVVHIPTASHPADFRHLPRSPLDHRTRLLPWGGRYATREPYWCPSTPVWRSHTPMVDVDFSPRSGAAHRSRRTPSSRPPGRRSES